MGMRGVTRLARALADARIVVRKDEDFLYLANQPGGAGRLL